jgi:DNA-binding CsgD family transcriptional regulator/GAF domain-containing protein
MAIDPDPRLVDALYRGVNDPGEFERALTMLSSSFACRSAALISLDAAAPATNIVMSTGLWSSDMAERYVREFAAIDPAPAAFARLRVGTASTTDRMLTPEERHCPFLHEFYLPLGLAETLGGTLQSSAGRFELIGLHRGPDRGAFEDAEVAQIERLMPHVARALQLRRAFRQLEAKLGGLEAALDRLEAGLVLLEPTGPASFINRAMQAIAKRGDGLSLDRRGRPVPSTAEARKCLDALLTAVARGGAGGTLAVPRPSGARPYPLLVAPAPSSLVQAPWAPWMPRGSVHALVVVHDPDTVRMADHEVLQQALGLSKGAARLLAALAAADDLKSFAEREGVTIHTARFHLRRALERTGTRSQTELVRLAVRMLRDFGLNG